MRTFADVTKADIALLKECIEEADRWRGALHPEDFPEHDKHIERCRAALARVEEQRKHVRRLRRSGVLNLSKT